MDGVRIEVIFSARPLRNGTEASAAHLVELEQAVHIGLVNRGVLIAPFHNMMLVSPATTQRDVEHLVSAMTQITGKLRD